MTFFWAAAAVCALVYFFQVLEPPSGLRTAVKTLSVAVLALIALIMGQSGLAVALALCAAGDAWLSREGDRAFQLGVASFAAGHIAYVAVFLAQPGADAVRIFQPPQVFAALGVLILGVVMALRILPAAGGLRNAVALYIPIILSMGLAALCLPPSATTALVLAGAALFLISDSLLAVETFLVRDDGPLRRALARVVWPSYWGAQALFLAAFTGVPAG